MTNPRLLSALLVLSAFLASADILVIEILAGRILAPYVGMSVYTWTAIISTILAGLTAGNWIGGYLSTGEARTDCRRLGWIFILAAISTIAILLTARPLAAFVLQSTDHAVLAVTLLSAGIFFLPALFGGMAGPVVARAVLVLNPEREGRILGFVYAAGSAGAILGSVLSGFVLIPWFGSAQSTLIAAALLVLLGALWLFLSARRITGIAALLLLGTATAVTGQSWRDSCDRESALFCIRVVPLDAPTVEQASVRGLVLDHLVHGVNVEGQPGALASPYVAQMHRAVLHLHPKPVRAFFVGGGAYTLPRAWAGALDVTVAEIDPMVTEVAADRLWLNPGTMTILHEDARVALARQPEGAYDVIVGDAFKDVAAPFHLVTAEFNALVRSRLAPGGLYLLNLVDRVPDAKALRAVASTLRTAFPTVLVWKEGTAGTDVTARHTFVLAATDRTITAEDARQAALRGWQAYDSGSGDGAMVLTDAHAPLEHLLGLVSDSLN